MRSDDATTPCPTCGYDLRASTNRDGARCPECGAHLVWREVHRHRSEALRLRRDRSFLLCTIGPGLFTTVSLLVAAWSGSLDRMGWPIPVWFQATVAINGAAWMTAVVFGGALGNRFPGKGRHGLRAASAVVPAGLVLVVNTIVAIIGAAVVFTSLALRF